MHGFFNSNDKSFNLSAPDKDIHNLNGIYIYFRSIYDFTYNKEQKIELLTSIIKRYKTNKLLSINNFIPNSSFILYDSKRNNLFLRTDEIGHFILYYYLKDRTIYFSTNLKSLAEKIPFHINKTSLNSYIILGHTYGQETIFKGIKKIPPSHLLYVKKGDIKILKYQRIKCGNYSVHNEALYLDKLKTLLSQTLAKFSKRNLGLMISGGIDSAILLSFAKIYNKNIKTYFLTYDGYPKDILISCRKIAKYFNTEHNEINISIKNYSDCFSKSFEEINEPVFDLDLPFIYYFFNKILKKNSHILHGFGSDNLFGGAPKMFIDKYKLFIKMRNLASSPKLIQSTIFSLAQEIPHTLNTHSQITHNSKSKLFFPYLDYHLVKFSCSIPLQLKLNNGQDKYLLRRLAKDLSLPFGLSAQKKQSSTVMGSWRKILIMNYINRIEKSEILIDLLGKKTLGKILSTNKPSFLLKLIIFDIWHKKNFR